MRGSTATVSRADAACHQDQQEDSFPSVGKRHDDSKGCQDARCANCHSYLDARAASGASLQSRVAREGEGEKERETGRRYTPHPFIGQEGGACTVEEGRRERCAVSCHRRAAAATAVAAACVLLPLSLPLPLPLHPFLSRSFARTHTLILALTRSSPHTHSSVSLRSHALPHIAVPAVWCCGSRSRSSSCRERSRRSSKRRWRRRRTSDRHAHTEQRVRSRRSGGRMCVWRASTVRRRTEQGRAREEEREREAREAAWQALHSLSTHSRSLTRRLPLLLRRSSPPSE